MSSLTSKEKLQLEIVTCHKYTEMCCLLAPSPSPSNPMMQVIDRYEDWRLRFGVSGAIEMIKLICECSVAPPIVQPPGAPPITPPPTQSNSTPCGMPPPAKAPVAEEDEVG